MCARRAALVIGCALLMFQTRSGSGNLVCGAMWEWSAIGPSEGGVASLLLHVTLTRVSIVPGKFGGYLALIRPVM